MTKETMEDFKSYLIKNEYKLGDMYQELDNIYHRLITDMLEQSHNTDYAKYAEELQEICENGASLSDIVHYLQSHFVQS